MLGVSVAALKEEDGKGTALMEDVLVCSIFRGEEMYGEKKPKHWRPTATSPQTLREPGMRGAVSRGDS